MGGGGWGGGVGVVAVKAGGKSLGIRGKEGWVASLVGWFWRGR